MEKSKQTWEDAKLIYGKKVHLGSMDISSSYNVLERACLVF